MAHGQGRGPAWPKRTPRSGGRSGRTGSAGSRCSNGAAPATAGGWFAPRGWRTWRAGSAARWTRSGSGRSVSGRTPPSTTRGGGSGGAGSAWAALQRAGWRCQVCGQAGILEVFRVGKGMDGGLYDLETLFALCRLCQPRFLSAAEETAPVPWSAEDPRFEDARQLACWSIGDPRSCTGRSFFGTPLPYQDDAEAYFWFVIGASRMDPGEQRDSCVKQRDGLRGSLRGGCLPGSARAAGWTPGDEYR